jgi:hypothetical protein
MRERWRWRERERGREREIGLRQKFEDINLYNFETKENV